MRSTCKTALLALLLLAIALPARSQDLSRRFHKRSNCHQAYDLAWSELQSGRQLAREEIEFAVAYEAGSKTGGKCPAVPEGLKQRATNRNLSKEETGAAVMGYVNAGDSTAMFEMAIASLAGVLGDDMIQAGYDLLKDTAKLGNADAQFEQGVMLSKGAVDDRRDNAAAFPLIEAAAKGGHVDAMFTLAIFHMNGLGTAKNPQKACQWFKSAAERGHVNAVYLTFNMLQEGEGTKQDFDLAYRLARALADEGDAMGMALVVSARLQGRNPKAHEAEIWHWFDQAERSGDANVRNTLAPLREPLKTLFAARRERPAYQRDPPAVCPQKQLCTTNHYSGLTSCNTYTDYWSCR